MLNVMAVQPQLALLEYECAIWSLEDKVVFIPVIELDVEAASGYRERKDVSDG